MESNDVAAIYCRISRDAEGDGHGVQRQEDECRRLAERMGLEVRFVFIDNDLGASERTHKSKVREQFAELVAAAKRGQFRYVVAYSNSRLTRRMSELEDLIKLHESTGVMFKTVVSGEDDLSTADGRMVARIKASVDVAEADRISERQKAAFRQRAMRGEPKLQRQRPFGWKADGRTIEPEEAALIREGVRDLIEGHSISTISKKWTDRGVLTAAGESEWHWTTLKKVLTGWRTAGVRTYHREPLRDENGELVMGTWEPIISMEERDQALARLASRGLRKERQGRWLLAGLTRCGRCGGRMYGNLGYSPRQREVLKALGEPLPTEQAPHTYVCKDGRGHLAIDAERLERYVELSLYAHLMNRAMFMAIPPATETSIEPWEGEARLAAVVTKIGELLAAFNEDKLSGEVVFPQVAKLETERDELRRALQEHLARRSEAPRGIESQEDLMPYLSGLAERPFADRQLSLRAEIEAVVIAPGIRGTGSRTDEAFEARVKIAWKTAPVGPPPGFTLPVA